ncbi:glycosyltransferase [Collinsella stercoris]|nr:glycosyltransferase [Collinsella stercoris]UEA46015.1 glycosyltransferase [Collinsella stercoris DSM 13279]UWP11466.1 glycosyltransferase [Collinsella stercoris]
MDFDLSSRGTTAHAKSVAVVLSTYNGSRYVRKQLDSLLSQRKLPDSIVISDDCSTDETPKIVRDYIAEHHDSPVSFEFSVNDKNIGWKANFMRLISHCEATYIFPCDQDDIWNPSKIESMVEIMEAHPDLDVLACSVEPIYEVGSQMTDAGSFEAEPGQELFEREDFSPNFMYIRHPGCSYCVRTSFVKRILPYWEEGYPHDAVLWRFAVLEGGAGVINERLIKFRRHEGNASDRRKQTRQDRIADVDYYIDFIEHAERFAADDFRCGAEAEKLLVDCRNWLDARKNLLCTGSLMAAIECLKRRRFYKSNRGLVLDLSFAWLKGLKV